MASTKAGKGLVGARFLFDDGDTGLPTNLTLSSLLERDAISVDVDITSSSSSSHTTVDSMRLPVKKDGTCSIDMSRLVSTVHFRLNVKEGKHSERVVAYARPSPSNDSLDRMRCKLVATKIRRAWNRLIRTGVPEVYLVVITNDKMRWQWSASIETIVNNLHSPTCAKVDVMVGDSRNLPKAMRTSISRRGTLSADIFANIDRHATQATQALEARAAAAAAAIQQQG